MRTQRVVDGIYTSLVVSCLLVISLTIVGFMWLGIAEAATRWFK